MRPNSFCKKCHSLVGKTLECSRNTLCEVSTGHGLRFTLPSVPCAALSLVVIFFSARSSCRYVLYSVFLATSFCVIFLVIMFAVEGWRGLNLCVYSSHFTRGGCHVYLPGRRVMSSPARHTVVGGEVFIPRREYYTLCCN